MISSEPIGGFFGLEPSKGCGFPQPDSVLLSSGRAALDYVLRATGVSHVHLPRYTCAAVLEPLKRNSVTWSFYGLDDQLRLANDIHVPSGELLIYVNYFGVMDEYCRSLDARYGSRLVIDCSQALYFHREGASHVFYSPRKFVGVPDGGALRSHAVLVEALERDHSEDRYVHLVGRLDRGPEAVYAAYLENEASLREQPLRRMSRSTEQMLRAIDFDQVQTIRCQNFAFLHDRLGGSNQIRLSPDSGACPLVYPYLVHRPGLRERLLADRIYVASYWPDVLRWSEEGDWERKLASDLLPLPIDQRYRSADMERILAVLR